MAIALPNTHRIISKLEASGLSSDQAVAITEAIQEVDLSELVTKRHLDAVLAKQTRSIVTLLIAQTALLITVLQFFR